MNDDIQESIIQGYLDFSRYVRDNNSSTNLLLSQIETCLRNMIDSFIFPNDNHSDTNDSGFRTPNNDLSRSRTRFRSNLRERIIRPQRTFMGTNLPPRPAPRRPNLDNLFNITTSPAIPTVRRHFDFNNLTPVNVRPSTLQIARATLLYNFNSDDININSECPITQNNFLNGEEVIRIRHCNHIFEPNALMRWFAEHVRCPLCRYDIRDYDSVERDISNNASSTLASPTRIANTSDIPTQYSSIAEHLTNQINNSLSQNNEIRTPLNLEYTFYTRDLSNNTTPTSNIFQ